MAYDLTLADDWSIFSTDYAYERRLMASRLSSFKSMDNINVIVPDNLPTMIVLPEWSEPPAAVADLVSYLTESMGEATDNGLDDGDERRICFRRPSKMNVSYHKETTVADEDSDGICGLRTDGNDTDTTIGNGVDSEYELSSDAEDEDDDEDGEDGEDGEEGEEGEEGEAGKGIACYVAMLATSMLATSPHTTSMLSSSTYATSMPSRMRGTRGRRGSRGRQGSQGSQGSS